MVFSYHPVACDKKIDFSMNNLFGGEVEEGGGGRGGGGGERDFKWCLVM